MIKLLIIGTMFINFLGFDDSVEYEIINPINHVGIEKFNYIDDFIQNENDVEIMNNYSIDNNSEIWYTIVRAYMINELTDTYLLTDGVGGVYELLSGNNYFGYGIQDNSDYVVSLNFENEILSVIGRAEITDPEHIDILENKEFIKQDIKEGLEEFRKKMIIL